MAGRRRWGVARGFGTGAGTENHPQAIAAKIELRENVFREIASPRVFDAFAGEGNMHAAVWHNASSYVGCDAEFFWDTRRAFVGDNRIIMRGIDLHAFNIFDLDAFGNVWEQVVILSRNRRIAPRERVGVVFTDGTPRAMALVSHPKALLELVGEGARMGLRAWSLETHEQLALAACTEAARRMGGTIARYWTAPRPTGGGPGQLYGAFIAQGRELPIDDGAESA